MSRPCGPGDYDQGAMPTVRAEFRAVPDPGQTEGDLFNPLTLTVTTKSPSGVVTAYTEPVPEITNPDLGFWDFTFPSPLMETGKWVVTFQGGGASASVWFTIHKAAVNV